MVEDKRGTDTVTGERNWLPEASVQVISIVYVRVVSLSGRSARSRTWWALRIMDALYPGWVDILFGRQSAPAAIAFQCAEIAKECRV